MALITDWLLAAATIALVLVSFIALFREKIIGLLTHPKLDISIDLKPPDCHKIPMVRYGPQGEKIVEAESYYFRFRAINCGNKTAESVEVFADRLLRQQADGLFKEVGSFLPMNLVWANYRKVFFPAISPYMYRHCDLGHIIDPQKRSQFSTEDNSWPNVSTDKTIFSLDTNVKANTLCHLLSLGKYHLVILLAAANAKPIEKTIEISLTGEWYDDEQKMLSEGIGIRII